MTDEIVFIDLNKVNVFGWENKKSDLVIDSIIRGIEAGDYFEAAVPVYKIDDNTYQLIPEEDDYGGTDGGHRRSVGHYIANKPLKCRIEGEREQLEPGMANIKNTILEDDDKMHWHCRYDIVKKADPKYR